MHLLTSSLAPVWPLLSLRAIRGLHTTNVINTHSVGIPAVMPRPLLVLTFPVPRGGEVDFCQSGGGFLPGNSGVAGASGASVYLVMTRVTVDMDPDVGESYCSCSLR